MQKPLTILGLESSCDETAASVVALEGADARILSNVVWSQNEAHAPYRGVVPEIAARAHVEKMDLAVAAAMAQAGLDFAALDGVAATAGPGLIGGVMVGLCAGKAIALARGLPFAAVNHLEGHALSPMLTEGVRPPYLLLLASGGHCQFLMVSGVGAYRRLGSTIDDAAGEAFDKLAKVLDLGFPGGPRVEALARQGDPRRFDLPRPMLGRPGCDLSFAGLKTAAARAAAQAGPLAAQDKADLCASFQAAMIEVLVDRARTALCDSGADMLVMAGGVAANSAIRAAMADTAAAGGARFAAPPLHLCTDNAAMIAFAGGLHLAAGRASDLSFAAAPRWPLDEAAAKSRPVHVAGRKGAKA